MRVGLCLTSNDTSALARAHPDDAQKLRRLVVPLAPDWRWEPVDMQAGVFPDDVRDFDAYVILGSPASVHDDLPWMRRLLDFVRQAHAADIPMVGLCLGHQAIALALGGAVTKSASGLVMGTRETVFTPEPWMEPAAERLTLYAAHKEEVSRLPDGARTIGTARDCAHASFAIGERIMTTQYHPEMTRAFMEGLVDMAEGEIDAGAEAARAEIAAGAEGETFARWIVSFLRRQAPLPAR